MKKILSYVAIGALSTALIVPVFATENTTDDVPGPINVLKAYDELDSTEADSTEDREVYWFWEDKYDKTITKNYRSISEIPGSIYYQEYNNKKDAWYAGTLDFEGYELLPNSKLYQATFSGTLKKQ